MMIRRHSSATVIPKTRALLQAHKEHGYLHKNVKYHPQMPH